MKKHKWLAVVLAVAMLLGMMPAVLAGSSTIPGLVSYWAFDEGSGGTASDSIGTNHGTIVGATYDDANIAPVPDNQSSLSFDGDDYVSVPHSASLNITGEITIAAWVRTSDPLKDQQVVDKGEHVSSTGYMVMIYDGLLYGRVNKNNATACTYAYPTDGAWHHVAYTFESGGQVLYLDGVAVATNAGTDTIKANTHPLLIGSGVGRTQYGWVNQIDEVAIFNRALDEDEIKVLMAGAAAGFLPPITNKEDFVLQDGTTLPIKFSLYHPLTRALIQEVQDVYLTVEDEDGVAIVTWELGEGGDALRFNDEEDHYIANFHTRDYGDLAGEYTATVYDVDGNELGSISFEISTDKGVGRGRNR